ncbi:MAG: type I-E CRISPR-associated protein Cse2/CasB [Vicinamibacterales bacterium]
MTNDAQREERASVASLVSAIAGLLRGGGGVMTAADASALRRMDPRRPPAAFFKVEGVLLDGNLPGDETRRMDLETRWAAIVAGLAHLGSLHQPGQRLGHVLADAQYSDVRFARLIRSDAERLVDELPALARFLAAKNVPVDWSATARLILSAGSSEEEQVRRNIARDYYGAVARQEGV